MPTRPVRPDDPDADAPEWWRRTANLRRIPLIAVVILVVIIIRASQGSSPPSIHKSCTTPAFVLSAAKEKTHSVMGWTVTGPPGMRYLLAVGASGFVTTGGHLVATPDAGLSKKQMQAASQHMTMDGDCVQSGNFAVFIAPGTYQARLFRLGGTAAVPTATEVDSTTLTVTPS